MLGGWICEIREAGLAKAAKPLENVQFEKCSLPRLERARSPNGIMYDLPPAVCGPWRVAKIRKARNQRLASSAKVVGHTAWHVLYPPLCSHEVVLQGLDDSAERFLQPWIVSRHTAPTCFQPSRTVLE